MTISGISAVRLEIGDIDPVMPLMTDEEYQYFLEKNNESIRKTSMDAARALLFRLASFTNEEVDVLVYRGSDYFRQYKEALMLYLKNPEYGAVARAMGYVGGVSVTDITNNNLNPDNNYVRVQKAIPVEYNALNVNNDSPFTVESLPRNSDPFSV